MIYLDNNATTPIKEEVFEAMKPYLTYEYGNPSSKYYDLAKSAKKAVEESREKVANLIGAKFEEIIFTSGASESTNLIIKGVSDYKKNYEKKGNHIITSKAEHKATLNTCKFLNGEIYSNSDAIFSFNKKISKIDRGFEVAFLDVDKFGKIIVEDLINNIKPTTILVSLIWGNNEIGTLNDISSISKICKSKNVDFHVDATQVIGKINIDLSKLDINYLSMSAHKIYGPKGIGAAYIKADDYGLPPISSLIHGGEQEGGIRGSTLAVHDIVGFGKAAEIMKREQDKNTKQYKMIDEYVINEISKYKNIFLIGDLKQRLPGVYSILIDNNKFNNERFLKKISSEYALSTGSACSAGQPSHVLKAIGLENEIGNILRISVSPEIEKEYIGNLLSLISNL